MVTLTQWQGEHDRLTPLSANDAEIMFERLDQLVGFEEAFPEVEVEAA